VLPWSAHWLFRLGRLCLLHVHSFRLVNIPRTARPPTGKAAACTCRTVRSWSQSQPRNPRTRFAGLMSSVG
jgi:hypothetical protein